MPTLVETLSQALALHRAGDLRAAESLYRQVVAEAPNEADAWHLLAVLTHQQGSIAGALLYFERAIALSPRAAIFHYNHGNALRDAGERQRALAAFRQALACEPNYAEAHSNLAVVLQAEGQLDEAWQHYHSALALRPNDPVVLNNLGALLFNQGRAQEALDAYRQAAALKPDFSVAGGNCLSCLQYLPDVSSQQLATAHAQWSERHAMGLASPGRPPKRAVGTDQPLRLGFVSPDLYRHPVGYFLVRLLESLDRSQAEAYCYESNFKTDDLTERLRRAAVVWRNVAALSDSGLADCIRADGVDLLFDLSGHTVGNRLLVFARAPAPVQATWLGYVGTTGLGTMDYLVADRFHVPPGAEGPYRERVVRMPDSWLCYDPPSDAPEVNSLPAQTNECVTLGSFNHPAKISPQVVETWSRILHRVPHSRLLLCYRGFEQRSVRARYLAMFACFGVRAERVELRGGGTQAELLAEYHRLDLALDTFPYSGGLTTCEALWMGVPVVTCAGETFAGRHSHSLLSTLGLPELIAQDLNDYVDVAARWAQDLPRLTNWRATLRDRMAGSAICDGAAFARAFAGLCREMWNA